MSLTRRNSKMASKNSGRKASFNGGSFSNGLGDTSADDYSEDTPVVAAMIIEDNSHHIDRSSSSKEMSKPYVKHRDVSFSARPGANPNVKLWPNALRNEIVKSFDRMHDEESGGKYLRDHSWPDGLSETVFKSVKKIAFRFFIVDDSGESI